MSGNLQDDNLRKSGRPHSAVVFFTECRVRKSPVVTDGLALGSAEARRRRSSPLRLNRRGGGDHAAVACVTGDRPPFSPTGPIQTRPMNFLKNLPLRTADVLRWPCAMQGQSRRTPSTGARTPSRWTSPHDPRGECTTRRLLWIFGLPTSI